MTRGCVALVSGGLDSTTLAYALVADGWDVTCLSVDYGQRHRVELSYAARVAAGLGVGHHVVDLTSATELLAGSALTDAAVDVPDGHYTDESMKATIVPNRNAIMLSIAVGVAVAARSEAVACATHAGDHPIYPDCRPEFIASFEAMSRIANDLPEFRVLAPFVDASKADIVRRGKELGVPFEDTWSCYRGGARHCGTCGTCVERREAFSLAGVDDPTEYAA